MKYSVVPTIIAENQKDLNEKVNSVKKYSSLIYSTLRTEIGLYQIRRVLRGSSTPYLSTDTSKIDDLGNIKVVVPSKDILKKIDSLVENYNKQMYGAYTEFKNVKSELLSFFT